MDTSDLNQNFIIQKYIEYNNFGKILEMDFTIVSRGEVVYTVLIQEKHLATPLAAHGGLIAALIDGALGIAALSCVVEENKLVSTVEISMKYLKPVLLNDKITAKAQVISHGKKLFFSETKVFNQKNELVATASGTFNAYPFEKANY